MTDLNRRSFLKQTSVGAVTLGLLSSVPALAVISESPQDRIPGVTATAVHGPLIAHVSDVDTGEVALLLGSREIIFRDPQLVARLMKAARQGERSD
ncbi:MAG TPA: twin-arginine translocation signal domain-containing protein [Chthoniobacterales bacterium]|jgi:hypothetical protein|nr:twin-arginine translocation signal domain-containing protein [Chthoniobacterales bacterium]